MLPVLFDNPPFNDRTELMTGAGTYVDLANVHMSQNDVWKVKLLELQNQLEHCLQRSATTSPRAATKLIGHTTTTFNTVETRNFELLSCLQKWLRLDDKKNDAADDEILALSQRKMAGSREWLLGEEGRLTTWICSNHSNDSKEQVLWLMSVAGAGKSVIAASLLQLLKDKGSLGAYFFCKHNDEYRNSTVNVVKNMAYQLAKCYPEVAIALDNLSKENEYLPLRASVDRLFEELIRRPALLLSNRSKQVFVVIDALDECRKLGDERGILGMMAKWKSLPSCIRLFFTSRPNQDIAGRLEDKLKPIVLEITESQNLKDIQTYTIARMLKPDLLRIMAKPIDVVEHAAIRLAVRASGLFIWIALRWAVLE